MVLPRKARSRKQPAKHHKPKHKKHHAKPHGKHKHHKRKHHKRHKTLHKGAPGAPLAPVAAGPTPPPPSNTPPPVYGVPTTLAHMNRLIWRAGFGGRSGQAQALAGRPLQDVVYEMTRPSGPATLNGPSPTNDEGNPLAPADVWGDDHCWWLDRMVRSDQQLVERLTLMWHDWFANSDDKVNNQQMMLDQNELFRSMALGSFQDLFMALTTNPAMLVFLDGIYNDKYDPNENYAREMMELFSLGADRGAYTEDDVREMARALTGWTADWSNEEGLHNFRFEPHLHDTGPKTVFGQTGYWNWEDAVRLCVNHPLHASFFVTKLWGYFIPTPPDTATLASLQGLYISSGFSIRAVVEAVLQHPDLYEGQELVTPPVVYNAGLLRAVGRYIDTNAWAWLSSGAGQQLFHPPNVSGWDYSRWLDTSTAKARWELANAITQKSYVDPWSEEGSKYPPTEGGPQAMESAMAYWGNPLLSADSENRLQYFAASCLNGYTAHGQQSPYRAIRQNALRMLIATSPDMQVS
jgi:Protein of unknown function (DUF1800)